MARRASRTRSSRTWLAGHPPYVTGERAGRFRLPAIDQEPPPRAQRGRREVELQGAYQFQQLRPVAVRRWSGVGEGEYVHRGAREPEGVEDGAEIAGLVAGARHHGQHTASGGQAPERGRRAHRWRRHRGIFAIHFLSPLRRSTCQVEHLFPRANPATGKGP